MSKIFIFADEFTRDFIYEVDLDTKTTKIHHYRYGSETEIIYPWSKEDWERWIRDGVIREVPLEELVLLL